MKVKTQIFLFQFFLDVTQAPASRENQEFENRSCRASNCNCMKVKVQVAELLIVLTRMIVFKQFLVVVVVVVVVVVGFVCMEQCYCSVCSCRPIRHVITVLGERMFEEVRERLARGEGDQRQDDRGFRLDVNCS